MKNLTINFSFLVFFGLSVFSLCKKDSTGTTSGSSAPTAGLSIDKTKISPGDFISITLHATSKNGKITHVKLVDAVNSAQTIVKDSTTNDSNISITFNYQVVDSGIHKFTLTVTDISGKTASSSQNVTDSGVPYTFGVVVLSKLCYYPGDAVNPVFVGKNFGDISWDFGDGSTVSNSSNPSHVYVSNGIYTITVTIYNSDHSKRITYRLKVVVGHRYFDSLQVAQIATGDSTNGGGSWQHSGVGKPIIGFQMSPNDFSSRTWWQNVSTSSDGTITPAPISFMDLSQVIELKPTAWTFSILNMQSPYPTGSISIMHSWKHDVSKDINNPMVLTAPSSVGGSYKIQIYWH